MTEIWKDIEGYEGLYQVSNLGRVKRVTAWDVNTKTYYEKEKIMMPTDNGHGYLIVGLRKNTERKNHYVHRLVATAFIDRKDGCNYINHLDYNIKNNAADNLEWCTQKENVNYSSQKMRHRKSKTYSKTGERYIYLRKGRYRIVIDRKEYPSCATLEEAVFKRDAMLREGVR